MHPSQNLNKIRKIPQTRIVEVNVKARVASSRTHPVLTGRGQKRGTSHQSLGKQPEPAEKVVIEL